MQLELRRVLGSELELPFKASSLYSLGMARLTDGDKQFVKQFVQDRMSDVNGKVSGLISIPMWESYMKQECQAELEKVYEKYDDLLAEVVDGNDEDSMISGLYLERCAQLQKERTAEINEVLFKRTMEISNMPISAMEMDIV